MAGLMTATQLTNAVLGELGRSSSDLSSTLTDTWLNWALADITDPKFYRHRELREENTQSLVTGQGTYKLAGIQTTLNWASESIIIVNPNVPTQRYRLWTLRERDEHEVTGVYPKSLPRWYSWLPSTPGGDAGGIDINILPAPGVTYNGWTLSIRRWLYPTLFNTTTLPNAVSQLHPIWDEVLVVGSLYRGWRHLEAYDRMAALKGEFGALKAQVASREMVEAEDTDWGPSIRYVDETMPW